MNAIKPLFFRRGLAFLLDMALLCGLLALVGLAQGRSNWAPFANFQETVASSLPGVSEKLTVFKNVQPLVEQFKNLPAGDQAILKTSLEKSFHEVFGQLGQSLGHNPMAMNPLDGQYLSKITEALTKGLQEAGTSGLSTQALKNLENAPAQISAALSSITWASLINDLFLLLGQFLLIPLFLFLAYFLLEGVLGASLGKFLTGVRVGAADGKKANLLVYLPRYLIKMMPSFLLLIAILSREIWWAVGAAVFWLVVFFSTFGVLGGRRQTLYDKIAGTSVFDAKQLADSQK